MYEHCFLPRERISAKGEARCIFLRVGHLMGTLPDGQAALPRSYPQQSLQDCAEEKLGVYSQDILGALLYRGLCYLRITVPSLGKRLCKEEIKKPVVFVD